MENGVRSARFRCDFTIKTVVGFLRVKSFQKVSYVEALLIICNI